MLINKIDILNFASDTSLYFVAILLFVSGITLLTHINAGSNQTASSKGGRQVATSILIMAGFILVFFTLGRRYGYNKVCAIYKV